MTRFLSGFSKKNEKIRKKLRKMGKNAGFAPLFETSETVSLSCPVPVSFYSADGNAAATDSTAALSFASMERMLQSMAAVKKTEKRDVLLMVRGPFRRKKSVSVFFVR